MEILFFFFPTKVDVKSVSKELGLDMDEVLEEVIRICETRDYNVGRHMDCTKDNVIHRYKNRGEIKSVCQNSECSHYLKEKGKDTIKKSMLC